MFPDQAVRWCAAASVFAISFTAPAAGAQGVSWELFPGDVTNAPDPVPQIAPLFPPGTVPNRAGRISGSVPSVARNQNPPLQPQIAPLFPAGTVPVPFWLPAQRIAALPQHDADREKAGRASSLTGGQDFRPARAPVATFRERYPDRSVKIEREVTTDADGNYLNHGSWTMWDERGNLLGRGAYRSGRRQGHWMRWYRSGNQPPQAAPGRDGRGPLPPDPYRGFERPFVSMADFEDGRIEGTWRITDARGRDICRWRFERGRLTGISTWWYPDGGKRLEISFRDDVLHGERKEWDAEGNLVASTTYDDGWTVEPYERHYATGAVYCRGRHATREAFPVAACDWWNGRVELTNTQTVDTLGGREQVRHGHWIFWHSGGGKLAERTYDYGAPVGRHVWWYPDGQKQVEGEYSRGKRHGAWTWWHRNGQKYISGEYDDGRQVGVWLEWTQSGRVRRKKDHNTPLVRDEPGSQPIPARRPHRWADTQQRPLPR